MEISLLPLYSLPFLLNLSLSLVSWLFISSNSCPYCPADQNAFSDSLLTWQKLSGKIMICSSDTVMFLCHSRSVALYLFLFLFFFYPVRQWPLIPDIIGNMFGAYSRTALRLFSRHRMLYLTCVWILHAKWFSNNRPIKKSANLCLVCNNFWSVF